MSDKDRFEILSQKLIGAETCIEETRSALFGYLADVDGDMVEAVKSMKEKIKKAEADRDEYKDQSKELKEILSGLETDFDKLAKSATSVNAFDRYTYCKDRVRQAMNDFAEKKPKPLDFIFLDFNKPLRCKTWSGGYWLFYWHPDKKWVSLREVTKDEVDAFPRNLSEKEQQLYKESE